MRFVAVVAFASLVVPAGLIAVACGGSSSTGPDQPVDVDSGSHADGGGGGDDGGGGGGGSDSGGGGNDGAVSCSNLSFQASDNPTCDQCAKDKCCKEVMACNDSADCKAFNECLAACADGDFACILTCADLHDQGAGVAQNLAACAQSNCKAECPLPDAGLSIDL